MITAAQCRAARGLLNWTQDDVAKAAQVGIVTVRQFEAGNATPRNSTLVVMTQALEAAGVEFIPENGGGAGGENAKGRKAVTTYPHFAQGHLGIGSIIEPGNWGRLMRRYQHKSPQPGEVMYGSPWVLARELLFEIVRAELFSEKPSRWLAAFMLDDDDAAARYQQKNDPNGLQVLHRVEIADDTKPVHRAALGLIAWPAEPAFYDSTRMLAERYWQGEEAGDCEVVTASGLRVVGHVE